MLIVCYMVVSPQDCLVSAKMGRQGILEAECHSHSPGRALSTTGEGEVDDGRW